MSRIYAKSENMIAKTSNYSIEPGEAWGEKCFTNDGASGDVKFTLPTAIAGQKVTFIVAEDFRLEIEPSSGDTIAIASGIDLGSVYAQVKGSILVMYCINATEWICIDEHDAWSDAATRGLFGSGYASGYSNIIDYITLASAGNATDFGDLTVGRRGISACSNGHGGLA